MTETELELAIKTHEMQQPACMAREGAVRHA